LCYSIAVALCDRRLARFMRTWKAAAGPAGFSTTHWPCCSDRVAMIDPSYCRRLVRSSLFSHHMPCLLSSLNDIRLQRKSGHHATLSKRRVCSPCAALVVTRTFPYPRIQTLVFPAQMKSLTAGGRTSLSFERLLQMCVVEPESRINASFNRYPCWLALSAASIVLSLSLVITRLSS